MKNELNDKEAKVVSGGAEEIKADIKTLPGDYDDYKVPVSDKIEELIRKYSK